jgi:hypothetical protein
MTAALAWPSAGQDEMTGSRATFLRLPGFTDDVLAATRRRASSWHELTNKERSHEEAAI